MTNRKNWPLALSVGPGEMNAAALEAMAAAGITQAELSSGNIAPFYETLAFPRRAKEIAALARACGVEITSVHLPFAPFETIDPADPNPEVRRYAVEKQSELLRAAGEAGITLAILHPSGEPYAEEERCDRMDAAVETVGRIEEAARRAGVTLCLENLPRTCLCRTSDEMLRFLREIPQLRAVFDTNHSLTEDNVHYIRAVGEKIVSLHVSDYDLIDERHLLPLEGKNDWPAILAALEDVGYGGRFLYELRAGYSYAAVAENHRRLMEMDRAAQ